MVSARRTRIDWAHCVKDLLDVHYPTPSGSCWCKTTPNTHTPASLYEAFPPAEAKRLTRPAGAALHAQARQLVEHGRDRVGRAGRAVPGSAAGRPGDAGAGGR